MEEIVPDVPQIPARQGGADDPAPGQVPEPPNPEPDIGLALLTADEGLVVSNVGRQVSDIMMFLNGDRCREMSTAQKNAFFFLSMTFGLERAMAFHPDEGVNPLDQVDIASLGPESMPFKDEILNPVPAVDRSVLRHVGFNPGASSTRIETGLPAIAPLTELETVLQRLSALEAQKNPDFVSDQEGLDQLIPCPKLGTKSNTTLAVKNLKIIYGNDKYSSEDSASLPIKSLLVLLSDIIVKNQLDSPSAYLCLSSVLKGDLHSLVNNFSMESVPFTKTWEYLQINAANVYSRDATEKDIARYLKTKPTSFAQTMNKLQLLYRKLYQYVPDPKRKAAIISTRLIDDTYRLISTYYPSSFSQIENMMDRAKKDQNPASESFDEAQTLIRIATGYLTRRQVLCSDAASTTPMAVEPQMMAFNAQAPLPDAQPQTQPQNRMAPQQNQQYYQQPRYPAQTPSGGSRPSGQYYGRQQQQQNANQPRQPFRMDVERNQCFKCLKNHFARDCRTYPKPSCQRKCHFCGGYHSENCVSRPQRQDSRVGSQQNPNGRRGYVNNNVYAPRNEGQQQRQNPNQGQPQQAPPPSNATPSNSNQAAAQN